MSDDAAVERLTEQVTRLVAELDKLSRGEPSAFRMGISSDEDSERRLIRKPRPPLPDPRRVRKFIRQRKRRSELLSPELFADPAWDMLLDLTAARAEHKRVSITSLCLASGVPSTTALRWIGVMTEAGLLRRLEDDRDRRRAFIELSDTAADAMARWFAELTEADPLLL